MDEKDVALEGLGAKDDLCLLPAPDGYYEIRIASLRGEQLPGLVIRPRRKTSLGGIQKLHTDLTRGILVDENRGTRSVLAHRKEASVVRVFVFLKVSNNYNNILGITKTKLTVINPTPQP